MIKLQIVGNLGKDCIVNEVNGKKVINFSVAHTERIKDAQGNPKERTTWVECAYWSDKIGVADYLKKGKMVYAEGAPSTDAYTRNDGKLAATLRMRVDTIQLLGGGSSIQEGGNNQQTGVIKSNLADSLSNVSANSSNFSVDAGVEATTSDDLPF